MRKRHVLGQAAMLIMVVTAARALPDMSDVRAKIATALFQGNAIAAENLANEALADPGLTGAEQGSLLIDRAKALELEGRAQEALADFTKAVNANAVGQAEKIRALLERGLLLDSLDQLDDAVGDYSAVLKLEPHSATALNNRANVYRRQNRISAAKRDYFASLAVGNSHPEYPYYGLGLIAELRGDTEIARAYYAQALAANPDYSLASERLTDLAGTSDDGSEEPVVLRPPKGGAAPIHLRPPRTGLNRLARPRGADLFQPSLRPAITDAPVLSKSRQVQLGAWRSEAEAAGGWDQDVKRAGAMLSALSPSIIPVDIPGKGRFYRLRVTPVGNAMVFCASLEAADVDCMPVIDRHFP